MWQRVSKRKDKLKGYSAICRYKEQYGNKLWYIVPFIKNLKVTIMNLYYTSVCHFCGKIYQSNKSTSKYCCHRHNSMFHQFGPQINNSILNPKGIYVDYSFILWDVCMENLEIPFQSWSRNFSEWRLVYEFSYDGPLPLGNELLLVSGYLIRKQDFGQKYGCHYSFKPFCMLTKEEKATSTIIKGTFNNEFSV